MIGSNFVQIGGSSMKCAKFGVITASTAGTDVDITELGLSNQDEYMVILDGNFDGGNSNAGTRLTAKTATSFTVANTNNKSVSYQVITFV